MTEAGEYTVVVTDPETGCSAFATFVVELDNTPVVVQGASIDVCSIDAKLQLIEFLQDFAEGGTWADVTNSNGLVLNEFDPSIVNLGDYILEYTEPGTFGRVLQLFINVNDDCVVLPCSDDFEISKVVTANKDGYNDLFEVKFETPECYFVNVQIFNRWGKSVYQRDNYQNTWDGYHDNSGMTMSSNAQLPKGTYYYIVHIFDSSNKSLFDTRTGYIYLGTQ